MTIAKESFDNEERVPLSPDYLDRNVSLKVVKVIESYVKIINKVTWQKWDYSS
jgi:UDP-N-acetylglucosamine 2-epimerase (non-hydrolysing)